jgi:hypothetical protein
VGMLQGENIRACTQEHNLVADFRQEATSSRFSKRFKSTGFWFEHE